jgi:hypothetical protein
MPGQQENYGKTDPESVAKVKDLQRAQPGGLSKLFHILLFMDYYQLR